MDRQKRPWLPSILRTLSYVALFGGFYPLLALCLGGIFSIRYDENLFFLLCLAQACGFFGLLSRLLFHKRKLPPWAEKTLCLLVILAAAGCACLALHFILSFSILISILTSFVFAGCCLSGCLTALKPYGNILSIPVFTSATVLFLLAILILSLLHRNFSLSVFLWDYLFLAAVFAAILNQNSIDYMMERRGHDLSHLPPKIRSYSVRILLIGFAAVALLIGGRKFFSKLADWVWQGIRALLAAAIQLIASLIPENNTTTPQDFSGPGAMPQFQETTSSNDTIFLYLMGALACIVFFLFFAKPLFRFLREKIQDLFLRIRRWLYRRTADRPSMSPENSYYSDQEEVLPADNRNRRNLTEGSSLRRWKRKLRAFSKMPDSMEKFSLGYALCVEGLSLHGVSVNPSDTTNEILQKSLKTFHGLPFDIATDCYNAIHYGDDGSHPAFSAIHQTLDGLRTQKAKAQQKK